MWAITRPGRSVLFKAALMGWDQDPGGCWGDKAWRPGLISLKPQLPDQHHLKRPWRWQKGRHERARKAGFKSQPLRLTSLSLSVSHPIPSCLSFLICTLSKRKWKSLSHIWLCNCMDYTVPGILQARILDWVAFPFSRGSSQLRDRTQVSHIAGGCFTSWATREALE